VTVFGAGGSFCSDGYNHVLGEGKLFVFGIAAKGTPLIFVPTYRGAGGRFSGNRFKLMRGSEIFVGRIVAFGAIFVSVMSSGRTGRSERLNKVKRMPKLGDGRVCSVLTLGAVFVISISAFGTARSFSLNVNGAMPICGDRHVGSVIAIRTVFVRLVTFAKAGRLFSRDRNRKMRKDGEHLIGRIVAFGAVFVVGVSLRLAGSLNAFDRHESVRGLYFFISSIIANRAEDVSIISRLGAGGCFCAYLGQIMLLFWSYLSFDLSALAFSLDLAL
jgi:hypothetical protein